MDLQVDSTASPRKFSVTIGDPFTVRTAREGELTSRPHATHLGDGELLLRISPDSDIVDEEEFILSSADGGRTWEAVPDWPLGDGAGNHLFQTHTRLPDGRSLVVPIYVVSTGRKDEYIIPAWISEEDGKSNFRNLDSVPFKFPFGKAVDWWDPAQFPVMKRGGPRNFMENFTTDSGTPSKLMADFQAEYGRHWLTGALMPFYTLDDTTLLAFIYVSTETGWTPRKFACTLVCLESKDWGRSWAVRSVPGPWDPALEEKIVARSRSTGSRRVG